MIKQFKDRIEHYNDFGQNHRIDGPAIEYIKGPNKGCKSWYINGLLHRSDGPAQEDQHGNKAWLINGYRHREDGPALEHADGTKTYWFNGEKYKFERWKQIVALKAFI